MVLSFVFYAAKTDVNRWIKCTWVMTTTTTNARRGYQPMANGYRPSRGWLHVGA